MQLYSKNERFLKSNIQVIPSNIIVFVDQKQICGILIPHVFPNRKRSGLNPHLFSHPGERSPHTPLIVFFNIGNIIVGTTPHNSYSSWRAEQ